MRIERQALACRVRPRRERGNARLTRRGLLELEFQRADVARVEEAQGEFRGSRGGRGDSFAHERHLFGAGGLVPLYFHIRGKIHKIGRNRLLGALVLARRQATPGGKQQQIGKRCRESGGDL